MGWTIGMPSLKLNNVGGKSKHCGSFASVAGEALEERRGRDADIDVNRADLNVYSGFRSAAELEEYSRRHVAELSARQVAAGGRKIRDDAVVMCATIIKPPAAMMNEMSREDQIRFLNDSKEKLAEIIGAENIKSDVIHFDELGSHLHVFWEPMTPDGRLCAKEMHNLQFLGRLNKEMPEHLRARGWDIENCKAYDQAKEELKTEKEKNEERARQGRSSASFKLDAEREKGKILEEIKKLEGTIEKNKTLIQKQEKDLEDLKRTMKGPIGRIRPYQEEIKELKLERSALLRNGQALQSALDNRNIKIEALEKELEHQKSLKPSLDEEIEKFDAEKVADELKRENSRLRELIEKILNYLKDLFPEAFKGIESILRHDRDGQNIEI